VEQVPTATGLTVRVINNVIKKCEVKTKFLEAFQGEGYPEAFKYRQKVVVLFQKMDGVDVALYVMYVQEYGAECKAPNRCEGLCVGGAGGWEAGGGGVRTRGRG
jgi:E1A/CREB-binding protein